MKNRKGPCKYLQGPWTCKLLHFPMQRKICVLTVNSNCERRFQRKFCIDLMQKNLCVISKQGYFTMTNANFLQQCSGWGSLLVDDPLFSIDSGRSTFYSYKMSYGIELIVKCIFIIETIIMMKIFLTALL